MFCNIANVIALANHISVFPRTIQIVVFIITLNLDQMTRTRALGSSCSDFSIYSEFWLRFYDLPFVDVSVIHYSASQNKLVPLGNLIT